MYVQTSDMKNVSGCGLQWNKLIFSFKPTKLLLLQNFLYISIFTNYRLIYYAIFSKQLKKKLFINSSSMKTAVIKREAMCPRQDTREYSSSYFYDLIIDSILNPHFARVTNVNLTIERSAGWFCDRV